MELPPADRQQVMDWLRPSHSREVIYAKEAYVILGLDRLNWPEKALQQLMNRGDLPRRKINGRLAFRRDELERLAIHGSRKSRRGRPKGSKNRPRQSA